MYKYLLLALAAFLLYKLFTTDKFSPDLDTGITVGFVLLGIAVVIIAIYLAYSGQPRG